MHGNKIIAVTLAEIDKINRLAAELDRHAVAKCIIREYRRIIFPVLRELLRIAIETIKVVDLDRQIVPDLEFADLDGFDGDP